MDSYGSASSKSTYNEFNTTQIPAKTTKQDLKKYFKLKLILGIMKNFCEVGDSNFSDKSSNDRVIKSTKIFIAKSFLQNIGLPDYIQVTPDHLSYSEKQIINRYLIFQITKSFTDSIDVIHRIKRKNSEFLNSNIIPEKTVIDLEVNRQQLYKDLVSLKQKKHKLLMNLIEIRLSPTIENKMKIIVKELETLELKTDIFYHSYLNQHLIKESPSAVKALKIIEATIDKQITEKLQVQG